MRAKNLILGLSPRLPIWRAGKWPTPFSFSKSKSVHLRLDLMNLDLVKYLIRWIQYSSFFIYYSLSRFGLLNRLDLVDKKGLTMMFAKSSFECTISTYAVMYFLPRFLKHFWGLSFIPLMGFFLLSLMMITSSCVLFLQVVSIHFGLQKLGEKICK